MAGHGFGIGPATQTGAFRTEDTQFTGADASQLDPTAHGADYGFLDFTQQEPAAADDLAGAYQFSSFSQVCNAPLNEWLLLAKDLQLPQNASHSAKKAMHARLSRVVEVSPRACQM